MGIFFNRKKAKEPYQRIPPHKDIILTGESDVRVYVYDGKPLKDVAFGENFYLEVAKSSVTMVSKATGTLHNTRTGRDYAVLYNSKPVGFMGDEASLIEELSSMGCQVRISAKRTGTYMPTIPEITAFMPYREELRSIVDRVKNDGRDVLKFSASEKYCTTNVAIEKADLGNVEIVLEEKPPSAKRKPRVILLSGKMAFEIAASVGSYKDLLTYVGQTARTASMQKIKSHYTDGSYYRIELFF